MTQTITNGTGRKSLAAEIDRLQETVGGLGETVREAVREATTQAVREAVGELIAEVVSNPDVATLLRAAQPQPPTPRSRSRGLLGRLTGWLQQPLRLARDAWRAACAYKGVLLAGLGAVLALAVAWKAGPLLALAKLVGAAA